MEQCKITDARYFLKVPLSASAQDITYALASPMQLQAWLEAQASSSSPSQEQLPKPPLFVRLTLQKCELAEAGRQPRQDKLRALPLCTTIDVHLDTSTADFIIPR